MNLSMISVALSFVTRVVLQKIRRSLSGMEVGSIAQGCLDCIGCAVTCDHVSVVGIGDYHVSVIHSVQGRLDAVTADHDFPVQSLVLKGFNASCSRAMVSFAE